jgi:hypothetical protein
LNWFGVSIEVATDSSVEKRSIAWSLRYVKVDAEDLDGGSTTSTELGEFTVAWGDYDAMPARVPEVL